jgi:hypothetical protein
MVLVDGANREPSKVTGKAGAAATGLHGPCQSLLFLVAFFYMFLFPFLALLMYEGGYTLNVSMSCLSLLGFT